MCVMDDMIKMLSNGKGFRVTIRPGRRGCADAQDACDQYGFLILYQKGDQFRIDDPEEENIVCVDDLTYIEWIIDKAELLGDQMIG